MRMTKSMLGMRTNEVGCPYWRSCCANSLDIEPYYDLGQYFCALILVQNNPYQDLKCSHLLVFLGYNITALQHRHVDELNNSKIKEQHQKRAVNRIRHYLNLFLT
jgi:hypothetical protein